MNYTATELGKNSGAILDTAQREPVAIMKHGRIYGGVVSAQDLELLENAKKHQRLRGAVEVGFSQIEKGQSSTRTADDIFKDVLKKRGEKSSA